MGELPVFPWNDVIDMSNDPAVRVFVIAMNALHEAINANTSVIRAAAGTPEETHDA